MMGNADEAINPLTAYWQKTADVILQDEAIFPELRREQGLAAAGLSEQARTRMKGFRP
jgi:hypothetical protein